MGPGVVGLFASARTRHPALRGPIRLRGQVMGGLTRRRSDPGETQAVAREGNGRPGGGPYTRGNLLPGSSPPLLSVHEAKRVMAGGYIPLADKKSSQVNLAVRTFVTIFCLALQGKSSSPL